MQANRINGHDQSFGRFRMNDGARRAIAEQFFDNSAMLGFIRKIGDELETLEVDVFVGGLKKISVNGEELTGVAAKPPSGSSILQYGLKDVNGKPKTFVIQYPDIKTRDGVSQEIAYNPSSHLIEAREVAREIVKRNAAIKAAAEVIKQNIQKAASVEKELLKLYGE